MQMPMHFSRLPVSSKVKEVPVPPEVIHMMDHLDTTPVSVSQIRTQAACDSTLSRVMQFVMYGWTTDDLRPAFKPFFTRKFELSVQNNCLLWGGRIIVPPKLQDTVLQELDVTHPGISWMKGLTRQYVWWPGIDVDIENYVKGCNACQETRHKPPSALLHHWDSPRQPWQQVHDDYVGPCLGRCSFC